MNGARLAPAAVVTAASCAFLVWSYAYEGRAHVVPMLVGWSAMALSLLDMLAQTDTRPGHVLRGLLSGRPLDSSAAPESESAAVPALACGWIAAFVALVATIGFIAAIPVYTFAFMRIQGGLGWRRCAVSAALVTAVTWVVFEQLLRYRIFEGAIFGGQF